ncbi:MAG: hypothetical protein MH132_03755 [Hydrotalea sp.]|nr:hypothetical protein [Hydrotalea sp.]
MADEKLEIEKQFKLAIDARERLNDNYHKWMTFYYVANGAILVAITTLASKSDNDKGIFVLALIGIFICILWNLSCKGYYYWSSNWINIILMLEKKVIEEETNMVYSVFSKKVVDGEKYSSLPIHSANISTPKLTLIFSFFSICSWTTFSIYQFFKTFHSTCNCNNGIVVGAIIISVLLTYLILPTFVKSRQDEHILI